jgi:protein TonB
VPAKHKAPAGTYTVTIRFLVDKTGKVTEVEALNDPGYGTAQDAINAFKHTPDWIPAMQNGKPVIYRQKQNITYQVTERL